MRNLTPTGKRWGQFWKDRRNGESVTKIAKKNNISVQAVYKALSSKNSKIDSLLLEAAKANRIRVYRHSKVEGFLWGYSPGFKSDVYIKDRGGMRQAFLFRCQGYGIVVFQIT